MGIPKKYNLDERTFAFSASIINFLPRIPRNIITAAVIDQLLRSATSIGANYHEADDSESKKDFKHKIGICKKESRETKYWLELIVVAHPELENQMQPLIQEAKELNLIFNAINNKLKTGPIRH